MLKVIVKSRNILLFASFVVNFKQISEAYVYKYFQFFCPFVSVQDLSWASLNTILFNWAQEANHS